MGQIKWYKRDPSAALNGMMELSLEERGAYNTVLDLIYSRDGKLHDDDRFVAGWLRVDLRVWKRIKRSLIERGKLYQAEGFLRNERADVEVLEALSRVTSAQEAGRSSARSKAAKLDSENKQNKDLDSTGVGTPVPTNHNHNHNHKEEDSVAKATGAEAPNPVDVVAVIFGTGVDLLTAAGSSDRQARSIIGKWRKEHTDGTVLAVLARCQVHRPSDPIEWISGALRAETTQQKGTSNGFTPNRATSDIGRDVAARLDQQADGFGGGRAPVSLPRPRPSGWPE